MRYLIMMGAMMTASIACAQSAKEPLALVKEIKNTGVKNQARTGTCWSFSTTSLVESQAIHTGTDVLDVSEMYTVRNIYLEKARNYVLRQGAAQFGPGGLGHDVIRAMTLYGAVPESAYTGLPVGQINHDHSDLDHALKTYLDSLLKVRPLPANWMDGCSDILDQHLGAPPTTFTYKEVQYTPQTFAKKVLHFDPDDYVTITSFSHHPFYKPFVIEVPDNFSNGSYYNLPLHEMIDVVKKAIDLGYSVMWDADVSNAGFKQKLGFAMEWTVSAPNEVNPDEQEKVFNQEVRQSLFENLTTQDDHLMHLVGIEKSSGGKTFFLVKNSWGDVGPYHGFIHVSEAYLAINTISLVVPKAAINKMLQQKLGIIVPR